MNPLARAAIRAVASLAVIGPVLLLVSAPADADDNRTTVVSVLDAVEPALPAGTRVQVLPDAALVVVNPSTQPLEVSAPDGTPFLRVSAAGVEVDAADPFSYRSRAAIGVGTRLPAGVGPGRPARWTRVSTDVSWRWYDPRLQPPGVLAPTGGRTEQRQVLASWTVPIRMGTQPVSLRGALELRTRSGWFRTVTDPPPAGVSAVVADGDQPSVVLRVPGTGPVTVLGIDGEPFLRRAADGGWEADPASRTYQQNLVAAGSPVPAGPGWRRYAEPGPVSWTDERLIPPVEVDSAARAAAGPTDVTHWRIPILLPGRPVQLTGAVRFTPRAGPTQDTGGSWTAVGLGAAVVLLGAGLAVLTVRNRRIGRDEPAAPTEPAPTTSDTTDIEEGAPVR